MAAGAETEAEQAGMVDAGVGPFEPLIEHKTGNGRTPQECHYLSKWQAQVVTDHAGGMPGNGPVFQLFLPGQE